MFDPRILISGPLGECPRCGQQEFGTLDISNNVHTRQCRNCRFTQGEALPTLQKKLVYLDQLVLSNMAKELDPEWAGRTVRRDPFWLELFDQLERLVKLQVIACPESPIHEDEGSYDHRVEGVLDRLTGHLACGVRFDFPSQIRAPTMVGAEGLHGRRCNRLGSA